ncbi:MULTISPECIES: sodium:solute symporter family protein [Mesorhizobium]|jgi:cation/acetate symporter|uniref:sodium:solute symporter family protein n=1 Tax=Mesorhizobium TaxID=68287 RepID=UPI000FE5F188|nr:MULTISPECIES: sodium:solute symporter family protein [Mesorhizobium]MCF6115530.1 cation acetate symporter [Mesorhizobium muleiense]RWO12010.1 MAG: cation acetate symporter [Mesorhizobium sp.]RWO29703.1 MAG: cation acetate symporter [Mesorhizobium sp.]RWP07453.1 MAG: cation acetate symporter [Mesorhizobium sp.]RWP17594.1 MAG: cation acetate symporter [Mesorhizobium sp.]
MANTTSTTAGGGDFTSNLGRIYSIYTGGFIAFIILMAVLSAMGVENVVIGYLFMGFTIVIYAVIGVLSRTMHVGEYYVAGRRVPALYNGMATGADWMSAASFIGMAGSLYLLGYDGLGFVLGWTGGYVLVAILVAPYLRKFGAYTVPDFLSARYGGNLARFIGVIVLFSCSFTYVVAQIFGTGLISARFLGIDFNVAVYVGLAGILVCSMLGGMRAVTWTQVAQYIVLIIAYLIPAIWMSTVKTGIPIPQLMQGQALANITALETAQGITLHHITPFAHGGYDAKNYFLLILCLMVGTASLPHVLMRYFTTPSVREARVSVAWSLLFIFILYFTAPAYAAFAKWTMLDLVASGLTPENIAEKAGWMMRWAAADNTLVQICGKAATDTAAIVAACAEKGVTALSFADINLNADMIVLATPEMAGMPYVISGLVAAGGLAAALSTADGLLLAIANALSHDIYYKMIDQNAPTSRRLIVSRILLVMVAVLAAYVASTKPSDILSMVSWAFSLAAGGLFPALVLGVWWKRANTAGAVAGMIAGFGITLFYLVMTQYGADFDKATPNMELWWGVKNISSATFGLPVGFAVMIIVSLLTRAPSRDMQDFIEEIRVPRGKQMMEEKTA